MRFLCFPSDLEGVGSYRILYPYMMLETKGGHSCQVEHHGSGPLRLKAPPAVLGGSHDEAADRFLDADVYVLQRPFELLYAPLAAWLKSHGKTVVCDIDDWFHGIPGGNHGATVLARSARHSIDTVRRVLHHADLLTVSTPKLAELYGRGTETVVLPNYLLRADWADITPAYEQDRGKVRIGWQGWLSFRGNDLHVLKRALPKLLAKHPEVVFVNVGRPDALAYLRAPPQRSRHVDGAVFPRHAAKVAEIDIGLVPLTRNQFNECKCLDAATIVQTTKGLVPIAEVTARDHIWDGERFVQVLATKMEDEREGLTIITKAGATLTVTPEHRLLADGEWTEASQIKVGQSLRKAVFGDLPNEQLQYVPWPLFKSRQSRFYPDFDHHAGKSLPRVAIDKTWGELLGFFVGDGSIGASGRVNLSVDGQDQDVLARGVELFKEIGLVATTASIRTYSGEILRRQSVFSGSARLVEFLRGLGVVDAEINRRTPLVPEVIFRSPSHVRAAFLRGYFEADGTVTNNGVQATSKDYALLWGTKQLLLTFGIQSVLRLRVGPQRSPYADRIYWNLSVGRAGSDRFKEKIGFVGARKNEKLAARLDRQNRPWHQSTNEDEIIAITESILTPVDLQVEGQVFVAEGILSHNSSLKAQEYGACGAPFIASPSEPNVAWCDGTNGLLAANPKEWCEALDALLEGDLWRRMGAANRAKSQAHMIDEKWTEWAALYEPAAKMAA